MNTLIISIGSNENSKANIQTCRTLLCDIFDTIYFSETSITSPFGKQYKNNFLNQLAFICTNEDLEEVIFNLKLIEKQIGRKAEDKANGSIKIDADVVKWNDSVLKQEDWQRSYVVDLLPSLYKNAIDFL